MFRPCKKMEIRENQLLTATCKADLQLLLMSLEKIKILLNFSEVSLYIKKRRHLNFKSLQNGSFGSLK